MKHKVSEHHLPGGVAGLVIDVPGSAVVSLQIRFNSGYQFSNPKRFEVPHVMEHLLATVTQKFPGPNEFIIEAQKKGAYVNASTDADVNGYHYEFADFETERMLGLVAEQIARPLFASAALAAEIGNVREELSRNTTNHSAVCAVRLGERTFPGMWMDYEKRIQQLPDIKAEHVKEHYHRTHTAANARFCIAGHFPDGGAEVVRLLGRVSEELREGERLERDKGIGLGLQKPLLTRRDIKQIYYRAVMYFGELTEPERRALTLLRMVLVGGMGARVLGEARRRGLAYAVGVVAHTEPGNSSFGFGGYVTPGNAKELYELMGREYAKLRAGDVTAEELEAAKDLVIGSIKRSTQTASDILGWYLEPYDATGEIRDFDHNLELLREVRPDEVAAVAEKAAAAGRHGLSFVADVNEKQAEEYEAMLAPMWSS
jgi:predicted Zn-dependent peptidase